MMGRIRKKPAAVVVLMFVLMCALMDHPQFKHFSPVSLGFYDSSNGSSHVAWSNRTTQNYYSNIRKGDVAWLKNPEDFFHRLEREAAQTLCRRLVEVGGESCNFMTDGAKLVCFDPDVILDRHKCVVYSFGVNLDISFDNEMDQYGCEVYMMDPTVPAGHHENLTGKKKFFRVGLAHTNMILPMYLTNYFGWKGTINATVLTYDSVQVFIDHYGPVHYLKMDIEGAEWKSLEYMMDHNQLRGIQQIAVEIHDSEFYEMTLDNAVSHLRRRWLLLERLEDHGFLRVKYDVNYSRTAAYRIPGTNSSVQTCGELLLVRRQRGHII
uniref:Methyltransferase-like protein 24 isoform X2 n=1 Tax=Hirondellea gigas TaxID=1518452 RepID=A0A6A7G8D6_9CRUS